MSGKPSRSEKKLLTVPRMRVIRRFVCDMISFGSPRGKAQFPAKKLSPFHILLQPLFYCPLLQGGGGIERGGGEMRETSKVIMGATLVMVVSLAIVLGLILVLLAELYCSLLLRRRRPRNATSDTPTPTATPTRATNPTSCHFSQSKDESCTPPHSSFLAHGVVDAPRNLLFPALSGMEDKAEKKKPHCRLHHVIDFESQEESNASPIQIGIVSVSSPPAQEVLARGGDGGSTCADKGSGCGEHVVYISNPIYDNDTTASRVDTPFETPDTSPSRLETEGSSGDEEVAQSSLSNRSSPTTPPLTPMKKLPAEACSVSLRNATSLGISGSDSNSCNGASSSSSSGSPCTSPSW